MRAAGRLPRNLGMERIQKGGTDRDDPKKPKKQSARAPENDVVAIRGTSPQTSPAIDALVERKKAAEELDEGATVPVINQFIDAELARLPAVADSMPESRGSLGNLDAFLHDVRTEM
jgi:hypothetical protein